MYSWVKEGRMGDICVNLSGNFHFWSKRRIENFTGPNLSWHGFVAFSFHICIKRIAPKVQSANILSWTRCSPSSCTNLTSNLCLPSAFLGYQLLLICVVIMSINHRVKPGSRQTTASYLFSMFTFCPILWFSFSGSLPPYPDPFVFCFAFVYFISILNICFYLL